MEKARLQIYAQRKGVQYPCYECKKEGPQHSPRFSASVTFNGQTFVCPSFFNRQKDAENAAAQIVLKSITHSQDINAKHQDERDINLEYKVLLLEASQKAKIPTPVYVTLGAGPCHFPNFTSSVQVIGMSFTGDPSQTKKQAERNAASAAWFYLKKGFLDSHHPSKGRGMPISHVVNRFMGKVQHYLGCIDFLWAAMIDTRLFLSTPLKPKLELKKTNMMLLKQENSLSLIL